MSRREGPFPQRDDREDGTSLAEMMIGMFLAALLGTLVMQAFIASSKGARHVSDDATVQQQQQTVVERMTRDLRVARGIDATSTASKVVVWDDLNSDYARQTGETITWKLQISGSQCQIVRSTDGGASKVMATTLTNTGCGSAYLYYDGTGATATSATATRIDVSLSFRASSSSGAGTRQSQFSVRMRNVA
jgi:Tfp pilus assembly protein PilW